MEDDRLKRIEDYLERSTERREERHAEVMSSLAVLQSHMKDAKDYQIECRGDRIMHEKRIDKVEHFQSNQVKGVIVISGLISLVFAGISTLWRH